MNFNGEDTEVNRTTTTEIKDVGSTKVDVPESSPDKTRSAEFILL